MQLNTRFIAYGAIIAMVYMTIVSSLDDISRLGLWFGCAPDDHRKARAEILSSTVLPR